MFNDIIRAGESVFFWGKKLGVGKKWPTPDSQIWLPISEIFSGSKICRGEGAGSRESVGFLGWKSRESGVGKARESETQSTDSQALLNTHTHTIPRTYVHVYVHTQTHTLILALNPKTLQFNDLDENVDL